MTRLTKIYTRTGDKGSTSLGTGERVSKNDPRVTLCGDLDEANSALGILRERTNLQEVKSLIHGIQNELFDIGAQVTFPDYSAINKQKIKELERTLDKFNKQMPPLKEFIIPGGNNGSAECHLARSIVRRCERSSWLANDINPLDNNILAYLNRLSDLLFVIARFLNFKPDSELMWKKTNLKRPPE
jgi:cob(I)alamin adenosyltransferase